MRLPQATLESIGFCISEFKQFEDGLILDDYCPNLVEMDRLWHIGLPPIVDKYSLAFMTGLHPKFIWSLCSKTEKYYRTFNIPKGGDKFRTISAPKVALKMIQKWLSVHFCKVWKPAPIVHGFVQGYSHITAAKVHLGATWIYSVDIKDFFGTTSFEKIFIAIQKLGYKDFESMFLIAKLCSYNGALPQGAPTSPILSNIAFHEMDIKLIEIADNIGAKVTRYADDIVFSGQSTFPNELPGLIKEIFSNSGWEISKRKIEKSILPNRLKVHGLLIHGDFLRLTKGYRNRIRAFKHLVKKNKVREADSIRLKGHINYERHIAKFQ